VSAQGATDAKPRRRGWFAAIPLVVFAGLAILFFVQLFAVPPSLLPSALIGRPVPDFRAEPIEGLQLPGLETADLRRGRVSVVNVWASWCVPCRDEHPHLMALARDGSFDVVGINNKDAVENARRFLGQFGNPFTRIGRDPSGRISIDWGVYGVPETFVVDGEGRIAFKYVGPLTAEVVSGRLLPAIRRAQGVPLTVR
jgi:cytochrome c biogenesis protein CcmG/thiol:disulfide interchange protein DsbE